jgi:hypothetical protein
MANQVQVDFKAEENELYDICTASSVAIYKCFDMFRVEMGDEKQSLATVYFGKAYEDDEVPKEVAKQVRSYVKEQKKAIRENPRGYSPEEGRQKLFWLLTMCIQHGVLADYIGRIQTYMTFVFDQTKEYD